MSEPFLGEIRMFGGNFAPSGWALCNGQLLAISQNTALFAILGTFFGGNGVSTFGLPDMQGRVPVHWGQGPGLSSYVIGEVTGVENVTLLQNQMPQHTHIVGCFDGNSGSGTPQGNFLAKGSVYAAGPANGTMATGMIQTAGGSQPFSVIQPLLCVTFIIALVGIFPSRN